MAAEGFKCVWTLRKTNTVAVVRCGAEDGGGYAIPVVWDDATLRRLHFRFLGCTRKNGRAEIVVSSAFLKLPRAMREAAIWH